MRKKKEEKNVETKERFEIPRRNYVDVLFELMNAPSPSGYESKAVELFDKYMAGYKTYNVQSYSDKMYNKAYFIGRGPITVLLSAHIDEVQARISKISDDGIISIISTGGICAKSLVASRIEIINDDGKLIPGIVEKVPIHCESPEDRHHVGDIDTFKINIGCTTKDEVLAKKVHPGSIVIYHRQAFFLGDNQICGVGLDDKVGVFICQQIAERLFQDMQSDEIDHCQHNLDENHWSNRYTICFLAATQEEAGLRGATVAAKNINPRISIDFDVTFASDGGNAGVDKNKYGDIKLGAGGVIQHGPDKSIRLCRALADLAKEKEIPFQYATSRAGGTNTDVIQRFSADCETALISIPNRNMHTPVEVVDKRDVDSIVDLVCEAIIGNKL